MTLFSLKARFLDEPFLYDFRNFSGAKRDPHCILLTVRFQFRTLTKMLIFRDEVDAKYRRAIEKLVRERRGADEPDAANEQTPCPFCEKDFDSYEVNLLIVQCLLLAPFFSIFCSVFLKKILQAVSISAQKWVSMSS